MRKSSWLLEMWSSKYYFGKIVALKDLMSIDKSFLSGSYCFNRCISLCYRAHGRTHYCRRNLRRLQSRMIGFLGYKYILPAEIVFQQSVPQDTSPQGCSQFILHPACICASDCPSPGSGSCTCPYWTSGGLHRPASQTYWTCSPFPPTRWLYHKVECLRFTQSYCHCHR